MIVKRIKNDDPFVKGCTYHLDHVYGLVSDYDFKEYYYWMDYRYNEWMVYAKWYDKVRYWCCDFWKCIITGFKELKNAYDTKEDKQV